MPVFREADGNRAIGHGEPDTKPKPVADLVATFKPDPVGGADPRANLRAGPVADPRANYPRSDAKPDLVADSKPDPVADSKPDPIADSKPDPVADTKPDPVAEPVADTDAHNLRTDRFRADPATNHLHAAHAIADREADRVARHSSFCRNTDRWRPAGLLPYRQWRGRRQPCRAVHQ